MASPINIAWCAIRSIGFRQREQQQATERAPDIFIELMGDTVKMSFWKLRLGDGQGLDPAIGMSRFWDL